MGSYFTKFRSANALSLLLLALSSALCLWAFIPEISAGPNQFNDLSFHLAILQQLHDSVKSGGSMFDFWFDASPFGYALFRSYQNLPHLIIYVVFRIFQENIPLATLMLSATVILSALLPWSVFLLARKLCFSVPFSAFAGILSVLISETGGYGMGMHNYAWGSYGIISQLWALVFVAPAIGYAYNYLRTGKGIPFTLLLVFLSCGSHILSVYLIGFTLIAALLALFIYKIEREKIIKRFVFFLCGAAGVTSYL